ncbi:hypothetical protein L1987_44580 [Smallanthus sonchifolius]|uniref:Uncharacterized protein n=1 Tax=Smallanthus sonchifolius TaxID=185202 RepID=A0ACB9GPZ2_9ASTR|nr:hypothetical protein L1987_44580 [Smallanthus sonchifolius]
MSSSPNLKLGFQCLLTITHLANEINYWVPPPHRHQGSHLYRHHVASHRRSSRNRRLRKTSNQNPNLKYASVSDDGSSSTHLANEINHWVPPPHRHQGSHLYRHHVASHRRSSRNRRLRKTSNQNPNLKYASVSDDEIQGSQNIVNKLTHLPFQQCKHTITTVDCQPSGPPGGMLVFVSGNLQLAGEQHTLIYQLRLLFSDMII